MSALVSVIWLCSLLGSIGWLIFLFIKVCKKEDASIYEWERKWDLHWKRDEKVDRRLGY